MSIVVAGSANVDFILRVARLPQPNQTITGRDMAVAIGGKGLNQAVVTLGAQGCATLIGGKLARVPAFTVRAVDATGAGDHFNGALVSRLVRGNDLLAALRYASAASALSVTKPSADSAATSAEVEAFLKV